MNKSLIRPAMIFIPFLAGLFYPEAHVLNQEPFSFVRFALIIMVFLSCVQLRFSELKPTRYHWYLIELNLIMGLLPYAILRWCCPDRPELADTAFFVGITPTATAAPVVVGFLNGRIGFALTGFTLSNLAISLLLPFLMPMVTHEFTLAFMGRVSVTIGEVILLPLFAAILIRRIYPKIRELPKHCKTFSFGLWSFTLFVLAAVARQHFLDHSEESLLTVVTVALISLLICIANFILGLQLAPKRYRREASQVLGQKNTTFTIYLALTYASPLIALGPIFYVFWHNCWNALQMYRYDLRRQNRKMRRVSTQKQNDKSK